MNGFRSRGLIFCAALVLAFTAGRFWPSNAIDAADALPVEMVYDGSLLWATATDPERQILVVGWAKEDWSEAPKNAPTLLLPKIGPTGFAVPVAVDSIDWAMAYELRPVGIWDASHGFRPCGPAPILCEWTPLPPIPPRPPKMITGGMVPLG